MSADEFLKILDGEYGVSGNEGGMRSLLKTLFEKYCDSVFCDKMGNVIGKCTAKEKNASSVMIEAHMDELGMLVSSVTDEGMLRFVTLGGFDPKILPGTEVTVHGKKRLCGVIGALPPHLVKDKEKGIKIGDMCVDVGFKAKTDAEAFVNIGDVITINTGYTRLMGNMRAARCIDDRGGLCVVLRVLETVSKNELPVNIYAVAAVQEELGMRGARAAAGHILPDYAIAVDVGYGISDGVTEESFACGKGPIITVGPNLDRAFTKSIMSFAKKEDIPFQTEVCAGSTGTDAWEIQVSGSGVKTALLSVPLRYMHSSYEVCDIQDIENAARIISGAILNIKGETSPCL